MHFRQFHDADTGRFTYLLADAGTLEAVVIDPVIGNLDVLLAVIGGGGLALRGILLTHVHNGGHEGAEQLRERTGALIAAACPDAFADQRLEDGDHWLFGDEIVRAIATPGHTPCSVCYRWRDRLFTGDTLTIGGCGAPDEGQCDVGQLFDSVTSRLFVLSPETLVFPARDACGRTVSTIAEERRINPFFRGRSREAFLTSMAFVAAHHSSIFKP